MKEPTYQWITFVYLPMHQLADGYLGLLANKPPSKGFTFLIVSGTINHVPDANKQTKLAARADMSSTLRGGQSSLSGGKTNIVLP